MATKKANPKSDPRNCVNLNRADFDGFTEEEARAQVAQSPIYNAAHISRLYTHQIHGMTDATAGLTMLRQKVDQVKSGDLSGIEAMLTSQATALDAIFAECARRACLNMGEYINAADTYMRMAMRAQGQCRATIQTLAEIKNPRPVAFIKQANVAHGPQQVNNGPGDALAPARNFANPANKLSGAGNELLPDTRAQGIACEIDTPLETVGAVNRPAH